MIMQITIQIEDRDLAIYGRQLHVQSTDELNRLAHEIRDQVHRHVVELLDPFIASTVRSCISTQYQKPGAQPLASPDESSASSEQPRDQSTG
jgi:hypothetical protein